MFPGRGHAGTKSKSHNEPAHVSAGRATFYKLWLNCEFVLFGFPTQVKLWWLFIIQSEFG